MFKKFILSFLIISMIGQSVFAQIQITYPSTRMVLQRSNANVANVSIAGNVSVCVDKIEARAIPMVAGQGVAKDWTTIQNNPQGGVFTGQLTMQGGWYLLEVRGLLAGVVVGSASVARIGVGEVFVIAGQSNASGVPQTDIVGANDDRVSCVNYFNTNSSQNDPPTPIYSHLDAFNEPSLRGLSAWSWGYLGDYLTNRLNVPILFFNAGWGSTAIKNWRAGAADPAALTPNIYSGINYPPGMPYANLRILLNYYIAQTGIRSVLWHQGENDAHTALANDANTTYITKDEYIQDLQFVISKTRQQSGKNISWVVARASLHFFDRTSQLIIDAQNQAITTTSNVFAGPSTDGIQNPRLDGDHFVGIGHQQHAQAWSLALDNTFFANSTPFAATPLPSPTVSCGSGSTLTLTMPSGFSNYIWSNGQTTQSITVGAGTYTAKLKDTNGNTILSQPFTVSGNPQATSPTITSDGSTTLCTGSTLKLTAGNLGSNCSFTWSTGTASPSINVSTAGSYSVTARNIYGCTAVSAPVVVSSFTTTPPTAPVITASGATTICLGNTVSLSASSGPNSVWSNGQTGQSITVTTAGSYTVKGIDINGCASPSSVATTVTTTPAPTKPTITASGATSFCIGNQVTLTANYNSGIKWNTNETTKSITVNSSGKFALSYTDPSGCVSAPSDTLKVTVNALPSAPIITPDGPTTFCQGTDVKLTASPAAAYVWSSGENTQAIRAANVGTYSVYILDANGCKSSSSSPISVVINPLPNTPTITTNGAATTFCPDKSVSISSTPGLSYRWSNNASSQNISTNQSGTYTVKVGDVNGCFSFPSNPIIVNVYPVPAVPVISASGPISFCAGGSVKLGTNQAANSYAWNNGTSTREFNVNQSGSFSVKTTDANGCVSAESATTNVTVFNNPQKPQITPEGPSAFCLGGNVVLTTPSQASYQWSNGGNTQKITIVSTGKYTVKITDSNGCISPLSDTISVSVSSLPPKPTIAVDGPTTFCEGKSVTLTSSLETGYRWSNGASTQSITVSNAGTYSLQTLNGSGCLSPVSASVQTITNNAPPPPTITSQGSLVFCEGNSVTLCANSTTPNFTTKWFNGESTNCITATKTGDYTAVVTDTKGCNSIPSNVLRVFTQVLPSKPIITQVGAYTLEAQGAIRGEEYRWELENVEQTALKQAIIKANKEGNYTVKTRLTYTLGTTVLQCFSAASAPFKFGYQAFDQGLEIHPNPNTTGIFTVEAKDDLVDADVIVFSMLGHELYRTNVQLFNDRKVIDLSNLPIGMYIVQAKNKGGFKLSKRVLINR